MGCGDYEAVDLGRRGRQSRWHPGAEGCGAKLCFGFTKASSETLLVLFLFFFPINLYLIKVLILFWYKRDHRSASCF